MARRCGRLLQFRLSEPSSETSDALRSTNGRQVTRSWVAGRSIPLRSAGSLFPSRFAYRLEAQRRLLRCIGNSESGGKAPYDAKAKVVVPIVAAEPTAGSRAEACWIVIPRTAAKDAATFSATLDPSYAI